MSEKKAEARRRTELERAEAARVEEKEQEEIRATCEPFLAERQLCAALISYCENILGECLVVIFRGGTYVCN